VARGRVSGAVSTDRPGQAAEPLEHAEPTPGFSSIPEALEAVARGEFVVVMDDEDRENEGDLIAAADKMTTERLAFMIRHTSGVVCVSLEEARADALGLPLMVDDKVRGGTGGRSTAATLATARRPFCHWARCPADSHPTSAAPRHRATRRSCAPPSA
jgi:hypothetical protein